MKVGITGHQDIPPRAIDRIRGMLRQFIAGAREPLVCVTSLADGADQMFAALVLEQGGRLHAVVPCARYEESFATEAAATQFTALLSRATTVETLPFPEPSEDAFFAAGRRVVDLSEQMIAVWDGKPARGKGGTADMVAYAGQRNVAVTVIWPPGVSR